MEVKNYPKEVVSEILLFLAEHEEFSSLSRLKGVSKKDVVEIIRDIANKFKEESMEEIGNVKPNYGGHNLSQKTMALVSCLSPREEILLFKSFNLI